MEIKLEQVEKNVVKLEITVAPEKFEEGLEKSYKKNVKNFNVPGFRKGKAPRNVVERYYGEVTLYEDAFGFIYPDAYEDAVKEKNLEPVEYPQIDILSIGKGKELVFSAVVTVKPEFEVANYKNVEISKIEPKVEEEKINEEIEKEQNRNARITKVEDRAVKSGDICVIDFEGFIDGVAFEGGKGTDYPLTIGSNTFIPGFEEQLIGKEIGQESDVNVSFPEEYHQAELASKPALFKVTVKEIKEKILPELNDEFAQDVSEFDSLEEYKNSIREKLMKKAVEEAKIEMENQIVEKIVSETTIDIPLVMIENRIDSLVKEFDRNLRYQGLDLKKYLQFSGVDAENFRSKFAKRAEDEVRASLVLDKISKMENVDVTDEDIDNNIREMAVNYGDTYENFCKYIGEKEKESIKDNLIIRKTVEFLIDNARVV